MIERPGNITYQSVTLTGRGGSKKTTSELFPSPSREGMLSHKHMNIWACKAKAAVRPVFRDLTYLFPVSHKDLK